LIYMQNDYGTSFNVAHIESGSNIYGPGIRYVIWFQGCSLHCHGCWNSDMLSFAPNHLIKRMDLLQAILQEHPNGVTFLGGEPLEQSDNLLWIMKQLKNNRIHIMLYTGYEMNEIKENHKFKDICSYADILICGRYSESERDIYLQWRGSRNQQVIIQDGKTIVEDGVNEIEVVINEDGSILCLGYPDENARDFFNH